MEEMYEFVKEHLSLRLIESSGRDYMYAGEGLTEYKSFKIQLVLRHPTTGEDEVISSESFSIG